MWLWISFMRDYTRSSIGVLYLRMWGPRLLLVISVSAFSTDADVTVPSSPLPRTLLGWCLTSFSTLSSFGITPRNLNGPEILFREQCIIDTHAYTFTISYWEELWCPIMFKNAKLFQKLAWKINQILRFDEWLFGNERMR